ncbi:molybdopterin-dependent oxidoreductase [Variovorax sp.]|uniref:molybdopterin-dependent oxidoreductase n=1 Tax=Variovorax sp. TaxID=1871043 RepID=UPI003BA8F003
MDMKHWSAGVMSGLVAVVVAGCGGGGDGAVFLPTMPPPAPAPAPPSPPPPPPPAPPAPAVKLEGAVDRPADYAEADLAARAAITQTVNFNSGSTPQTRTYTGTSLWSLLSDAGIQTDATRKNDVLSRYLLATGADGYKVVFTLGELNPDFGNKPAIVAYAETTGGGSGPLAAADGPFRVTAPGDIKGGRYVSQLVRLRVQPSAATAAGTGGGVSASFAVSGAVTTPLSFDLKALQAMVPVTQTVGANVYTGVSLWTLLNSLGLRLPAGKNPSLSMYAVATGSDGYRAAVSLGEIDPGFGNKGALVAYDMNGAGLGANGVARLVVPGEVKQGRSVSNLVAIEVFAADTP